MSSQIEVEKSPLCWNSTERAWIFGNSLGLCSQIDLDINCTTSKDVAETAVSYLALQPNGQKIAVGLDDSVLLRSAADISDISESHTLCRTTLPVSDLKFSHDGRFLYAK